MKAALIIQIPKCPTPFRRWDQWASYDKLLHMKLFEKLDKHTVNFYFTDF